MRRVCPKGKALPSYATTLTVVNPLATLRIRYLCRSKEVARKAHDYDPRLGEVQRKRQQKRYRPYEHHLSETSKFFYRSNDSQVGEAVFSRRESSSRGALMVRLRTPQATVALTTCITVAKRAKM